MQEYGIPNAIRDENLRLVLAREEKHYIISELAHSRQVVMTSLAVLAAGLSLMAGLAVAFSLEGKTGPTLVAVGLVGLTLVSAGVIAAYLRYRRFRNYERDFRAFLEKYDRVWDNI
jgi:uncharacterized membrane protein YidH (DUF202 family)